MPLEWPRARRGEKDDVYLVENKHKKVLTCQNQCNPLKEQEIIPKALNVMEMRKRGGLAVIVSSAVPTQLFGRS